MAEALKTALGADLCAVRALQALERIAESGKRTREDWRAYGTELLASRRAIGVGKQFDRKFNQWIRAHGLDSGPAKDRLVRADAMWLSDKWDYVVAMCGTGSSHSYINNPHKLRAACRKAGYEWSVSDHKRAGPAVVLTKAKRELSEVSAEVATLPETMRRKFARLVETAERALASRFDAEVKAAVAAKVEERTKAQAEFLKASIERQQRSADEYEQRSKRLDAWMTQDEFRLVLSCLHPDRQPEDQRAKYDKAFGIFKRLDKHLSPDRKTLAERGWAQ